MPNNNNNHHTQWAGTFAFAAKLSLRRYCVSITLGNTPSCDLLCISPEEKGTPFKVEVKSTNSPNFIRIQKKFLEKPVEHDLFLVVVLLPDVPDLQERFFILTHHDAQDAWAKVPKVKQSGEKLVEGHEGLNWGLIKVFENKWEKFPV